MQIIPNANKRIRAAYALESGGYMTLAVIAWRELETEEHGWTMNPIVLSECLDEPEIPTSCALLQNGRLDFSNYIGVFEFPKGQKTCTNADAALKAYVPKG